MAELADAVPKDRFEALFGRVREQVVAVGWDDFQKARPQDVSGICLFIWDEMVDRGVARKPFKIAPYTQNDFKGVAGFLERELKEKPVLEAYAVSYFNDVDPRVSFADVSLVRCWPNDLHIADVEFSDNRMPLPTGSKVKGSINRGYRGLHVFGEFIGRLKRIATEKGVERISLMVADRELYPVFKRHGFKLSTTKMAQIAFKGAGVGFPMILEVK
ncbi:hypothetical protein [Mesorhizobium sp.]|uniref:hypothetical protein n=1 Tax=Mesorhizobium sp. TaxID=1871066 RepID=UPI000FE96B55|nr:hypothetical protein [Mesorhizobium sp.]RWI99555.1 MAG: hypothetical protein EOR21_02345 [Mesorhizobium sp.]